MSRLGPQLEIEHWEAHLYHLMCGRWADKRCRVCGLKWKDKNIREQWEQAPKLRAVSDFGELGQNLILFD